MSSERRALVGYSSARDAVATPPGNTPGPTGTSGDLATRRQGSRPDKDPDYLACCIFCYLNIDEQAWKQVTTDFLKGIWDAFSDILAAESAAKCYEEYHRVTQHRETLDYATALFAFLALGDFQFKWFELVVQEPKELYVIDVTLNVVTEKVTLSRSVLGEKGAESAVPESVAKRLRPVVRKLAKPLNDARLAILKRLLRQGVNEAKLVLAKNVLRKALLVADATFLGVCAGKCAVAKLEYRMLQFRRAFTSALDGIWAVATAIANNVFLPLVVAKVSLDNDNLRFRAGLPATVTSRFNQLLAFLWLTRGDSRAATLVELMSKPLVSLPQGKSIMEDVIDGVALYYDIDNGSLGTAALTPLPGTREDVRQKVIGLSTLQLVRYLDFTGVLYFKQDPEALASAALPRAAQAQE